MPIFLALFIALLGLTVTCLIVGLIWMLSGGRTRMGAILLGVAALGGLAMLAFAGAVYGVRLKASNTLEHFPQAHNHPSETPLIRLEDPSPDEDRPDWVERPARQTGDTYEVSVASDPKLTPAEAMADLRNKRSAEARSYVDALLGKDAAQRISVSNKFIDDRIQRETFLQPVTMSVGSMYVAHALLVFDRSVQEEYRQQFQAAEVQWRMTQTGATTGLVLAALAAVFGLLKLDTATRGYYSGRLQVIGAGVILAMATAGYALVWHG